MSYLRKAALSTGLGLLAGIAALSADAAAPPKKIAILLFDGVEIIDYSGPYEVFADQGYDVFTVAATKDPIVTAGGDGMKITPKYSFADAPQADLLLIPGGDVSKARKSEPTLDWIKRETAQAQHTMSVCNGAFILASAGLLDGLSATTTAGNIPRLKSEYPKIKVVSDQRFVDNGKIVTTAGLSAGIDGALHMLDVMEGEGTAESVALAIEYDWHPQGGYVRAALADRLIPSIDFAAIGEPAGITQKGDKDHWSVTGRFTSQLSAPELTGALKAALEKGYATEGLWSPGSFQMMSSGPLAADLRYGDRDGHHWKGNLTVAQSADDTHQFVVGLTTAKVD